MRGAPNTRLSALAFLGFASTLTLLSAGPARAEPVNPDDALAVYCLSAAHRAELAQAARTLGLASPGPAPSGQLLIDNQPTELETWRTKQPAQFRRACRALMSADPKVAAPQASTSWSRPLEVVLPPLAAALLAFLAAGWRSAIERGSREAAALREAAANFRGAMLTYATEWVEGGRPSAITAELRRTDLIRQLSTARVSAKVPPSLSGPALAVHGSAYWLGMDKSARAEKVEQLRTELGELDVSLEEVALALTRPLRSRLPGSGMRRK